MPYTLRKFAALVEKSMKIVADAKATVKAQQHRAARPQHTPAVRGFSKPVVLSNPCCIFPPVKLVIHFLNTFTILHFVATH